MISHFHGSKYNRLYRDKRVFLLVSCCSPYSILWVFQVLTIFIFLLIFSHFILHLRLFFLISHNSMFFVHFAQLDWNLLHQIWDFTPAFLSFPYFVLYLPAEIHKRQIAFCFPHEVGTFLSRLYFFSVNTYIRIEKFMRLKKLIHAILMSFIIGNFYKLWWNKSSIKMNKQR